MTDNLSILTDAKREYMCQLCLVMCPAMIETFQELYNESIKNSKGKQVLIMFQKLLKEVPNWSNAMSKRHADNITDRCSWYGDLLAAVFVACTKILSAVRLKADNKKISLKLPTEEVFIQTCYNNAARDLYKDPYIFNEEQSEYVRDDTLTARFSVVIETTVKELIPVQQILQTYMSQETRDISLDGEVEDSQDPEIMDMGDGELPEENEAVEEEKPEGEADAEGEAAAEGDAAQEDPCLPEPQLTGLENEFKTVPGVRAPALDDPRPEEYQTQPPAAAPPPAQDDGVLFGDAPDRPKKYPRYN